MAKTAVRLDDEHRQLLERLAPAFGGVVTATVWLAREDRQLLERLVPKFGGRAATVREALRRLAADHDRMEAFGAFAQAREGDSIVASYQQVPQDPAEDAAALANAIAMTEAEPWRYKAGS